MKIGITCYPTYGGSGIVATELGLELATRGHEVHFITYANPIRLDPGIAAHPLSRSGSLQLSAVPVSALLPGAGVAHGGGGGRLRSRSAARALRDSALDRGAAGPADGGRRADVCRSSPRCMAPTSRWSASDQSYFPITKFSIEKSNGDHQPSATICAARRTRSSASPNEIRVIHNFVNMRHVSARSRTTRPNGEKRLMHISNFRPVKRVLDCIRILAEVLKTTPAHLYMVGDGPDAAAEAHRLARELGSRQARHFLGKQDHVERLIPQHARAADAERNGIVRSGALEAMACGVPPVATRVGRHCRNWSPTAWTDSSKPVGDIAAQAARVVELLTNDDLYQKMSAAARRTAVERFASSIIIPQYERYYMDILAGGPN